MQNGDGIKKTFFSIKAPTRMRVGRAALLAPTSFSVSNNGDMHYRGEEGYQSVSGIFTGGEIL